MERFDVAVIGAGVIGAAVALELSRRGASVLICEADAEPALAASATNSGILHTGFDSTPGELETRLILRSGELRGELLERLAVPIHRCGAVMRPRSDEEAERIGALAAGARENGVATELAADGSLNVPGESITDPVALTLGMLAAALALGATVRRGAALARLGHGTGGEGLELELADGSRAEAAELVNCAGLGAGRVARLVGDTSFDVFPRKGEFLLFEVPGEPVERILLPVPTQRTKGVLVFPLLDGRVAVGPTAVDLDHEDWSVRPQARDELLTKAHEAMPELTGVEPVGAWAGLRPTGADGANYVIGRSAAEPRLTNVAAIRSTGLTASPGIAEHVAAIVSESGVASGDRAELPRLEPVTPSEPWYERVARRRTA